MITLYWFLLFLLSIYGIHRLHILFLVHTTSPIQERTVKKEPNVLIQVPIFNEKYVAKRIIKSCMDLDWPKENLFVQILDDSTDETTRIIEEIVEDYKQRGFWIELIHRENRAGYKAGALDVGLQKIQNPNIRSDVDVDFVAIFDADFVPKSDFLQKSMAYFEDAEIGMVQSRWGHINREENVLTRWSAILLDGHFVLEHSGRFQSGRIFNFNGTAGVWRIAAIETAGGWQHDTITEDLDLSYRAAMKEWKFVYLPHNVAPAELPATTKAFSSQQHRWAKGTIQVAKKLLIPLWKSNVSLKAKIEGSIHFTSNIAYPMTVLLIALMPYTAPMRSTSWMDGVVFLCTCLSILLFYGVALWKIGILGRNWWHIFPTMGLGVGMTFRQSLAVFEGFFGHDRHFVRTPKKGNESNKGISYLQKQPFPYVSIVEIIFATYCVERCFFLIEIETYGTIPFLLLFAFGFYFVGISSIWEQIGDIMMQQRNDTREITVGFDKNLPKHP